MNKETIRLEINATINGVRITNLRIQVIDYSSMWITVAEDDSILAYGAGYTHAQAVHEFIEDLVGRWELLSTKEIGTEYLVNEYKAMKNYMKDAHEDS